MQPCSAELSGPVDAACPPRGEQLVLQAEHLLVLLRLGVVVAEQVQDAVHGEQLELGVGRWPAVTACRSATAGQSTRSPRMPSSGSSLTSPGPQLVHREGEHVGRPLALHPLLVELGHGVLVDGLDAQLGERVDPHPVQHEPAQPDQVVDVEVVRRTR